MSVAYQAGCYCHDVHVPLIDWGFFLYIASAGPDLERLPLSPESFPSRETELSIGFHSFLDTPIYSQRIALYPAPAVAGTTDVPLLQGTSPLAREAQGVLAPNTIGFCVPPRLITRAPGTRSAKSTVGPDARSRPRCCLLYSWWCPGDSDAPEHPEGWSTRLSRLP